MNWLMVYVYNYDVTLTTQLTGHCQPLYVVNIDLVNWIQPTRLNIIKTAVTLSTHLYCMDKIKQTLVLFTLVKVFTVLSFLAQLRCIYNKISCLLEVCA